MQSIRIRRAARLAVRVVVLALAGACSESLDYVDPPVVPFNLSGRWHVVETEKNADLLTCTLEYDLTLIQDMAGAITGVSTGIASAPCHETPKTAADSAIERVDPTWGLTLVTIAPTSVNGYLAVRALLLDLGSAAWHYSGTQNIEGLQAVIGVAGKNDGELPAGSTWSGTFRMVRLGAGS